MSDAELLQLAADAIGLPPLKFIASFVGYWDQSREGKGIGCNVHWNPLTDDGDALRLAVNLGMEVSCDGKDKVIVGWPDPSHPGSREADECVFYSHVTEPKWDDPCAATRRAIVRAAAQIGKTHD